MLPEAQKKINAACFVHYECYLRHSKASELDFPSVFFLNLISYRIWKSSQALQITPAQKKQGLKTPASAKGKTVTQKRSGYKLWV